MAVALLPRLMDETTKTKALTRFRRISGQLNGVQRMVEDDRYCVDVLIQVAAVQAALMEVGRVILAGHFENCLTDAMRSRDEHERRKKIDELMGLFSRFCHIEGPSPEGDVDDATPTKPRSKGRRP